MFSGPDIEIGIAKTNTRIIRLKCCMVSPYDLSEPDRTDTSLKCPALLKSLQIKYMKKLIESRGGKDSAGLLVCRKLLRLKSALKQENFNDFAAFSSCNS